MDKVLVIGDDMRSFLATVRSLGRQGLEVHVAPYDFSSAALASRYIHRIHALPFYLDGGHVWLETVKALLASERFSLVIPCDERCLLPLVKHADELRQFSELAIPDARGMALFFDKHNTREFARSLAIPVARGRVLTGQDDVDSLVAEIGLPLILKYRKSYSWPELYVRTKTSVIETKDQFVEWIANHHEDILDNEILVEKIFPGVGIGVSVLAGSGKVFQAFEHHRVRELNGSGYYRKSAALDPGRLDAVSRMVARSGYTGIAMFEFKVNVEDNSWILLEVNARPWGSLPLPVSVGIDFPYRLYKFMVKGEVTPALPYKAEMFGRNLVQDLGQVKTVTQMMAKTPGKLLLYLSAWMLEFRRMLTGREHHDGVVRDDRQPGWLEIRQNMSWVLSSLRTKILGRSALRCSGLAQKLATDLASVARPVRVLFLCEGNICRSPYAERKLQQLLASYSDRFDVRSAGMLPRNRRQSPAVAMDAAGRRGVDLSSHLSQHAFEETIKDADQVLIFDRINLKSFQSRYPQYAQKVFFIGELPGKQSKVMEVNDPVGKSASVFDATYGEIDRCLQAYADTALSLINKEQAITCSIELPIHQRAFQ